MKRYAALIVVLGMTGCHAPMPTLNPYSATRVPPPGTGSYSAQDSYYSNPQSAAPVQVVPQSVVVQQQPIGTGVVSRSSIHADLNNDVQWAPTTTIRGNTGTPSAVARTTFDEDEETEQLRVSQETRVRIPSPQVVDGTDVTNRFRGMRLHDATQPYEPARFVTPERTLAISQLPEPGTTVSRQVTVTASSTAAQPARTAAAAGTASPSPVGWKSRYSRY